MDAQELKIHRLNTTAFISTRPVSILLTRSTSERTAAGGLKPGTPQLITNKPFRIIELGGATNQIVQTQDGKARNVEFQLLGEWDADVKIGDYWRDSGRDWEVADVNISNQYESRAQVVERGK